MHIQLKEASHLLILRYEIKKLILEHLHDNHLVINYQILYYWRHLHVTIRLIIYDDDKNIILFKYIIKNKDILAMYKNTCFQR